VAMKQIDRVKPELSGQGFQSPGEAGVRLILLPVRGCISPDALGVQLADSLLACVEP